MKNSDVLTRETSHALPCVLILLHFITSLHTKANKRYPTIHFASTNHSQVKHKNTWINIGKFSDIEKIYNLINNFLIPVLIHRKNKI